MTTTKMTDKNKRQKERSKHSISLETFGQRRGQVRALEEFRHRKQKKRIETAKALRKYKKSMKSEGYEAGRGAARKRVNEMDNKNEPKEESSKEVTAAPARKKKSNPFQKSLEKAQHKKEEAEKQEKMIQQNQKEREKRLRERKRQSKLLAKRTKRGQPIMKHTVGCMLKKLEKQNGGDS